MREKFFLRLFLCETSGKTISAPKKRQTGKGHLKNMYCPFCKKEHNFVQIGTEKGV